jgi:hypothetical protein
VLKIWIVIGISAGRIVKAEAPKAEDALVPKPVAPQEADAFRGVHLNPNTHHWDEVSEYSSSTDILLTIHRWRRMTIISWTM